MKGLWFGQNTANLISGLHWPSGQTVNHVHPILVLTIAEYEFCMQAWLKDSLIDMMIDIQETLIERIQKLN